ncbi:hypothetical protein RHMOL_Rhmol04G0021900 [Rhododendron molle]|uniref:Uncharacterized protein n=1 Tax=Rhododendron molle TaxID=49168 RepID=A0ACC0NWG7_RHOML|nr:hypothetical protein RHMOL_Rhmol04G0021900 [Rhododendron molle]
MTDGWFSSILLLCCRVPLLVFSSKMGGIIGIGLLFTLLKKAILLFLSWSLVLAADCRVMDFQRERRVDNGVGGQHQNFKLAFCRQKRKRLFNTRLSHSPPTPPPTLPLLKDKEPSLAAVGPICRWMISTLNPKFYLPCRKRLFNTRLSHSPPTPPLTLPLLKDKEPSLAAVDVEIWKVSNGEGMYGLAIQYVALLFGLLNGKFFMEWMAAVVQKAHQFEISNLEENFGGNYYSDIFEINTGISQGLSQDSIKKLPESEFGCGNSVLIDPCREMNCIICLEDFKEGDITRILPNCGHSFHLQCMDEWLAQKASCPMCRKDV